MKKTVLALVLLLMLAAATSAFAEKGFDPDETPWGQHIQDTYKVFGIPWEEGYTNLIIPGPNVFGYKSIIVHIYEDERLACVSQMILSAHNPELDEEAMQALMPRLGQAYDKILGSRMRDDLYVWIMDNGDYILLGKEEERINLRRMPKAIWDKYWAHQL